MTFRSPTESSKYYGFLAANMMVCGAAGGGGGVPYKKDGGARRKFLNEPLRGSNSKTTN